MKPFFLLIIVFTFQFVYSQIPTVFEKTYPADIIKINTAIPTDQGYLAIGKSTQNAGDFWLMATDSLGELRWQRLWGGIDFEFGGNISLDMNQNILVTGTSWTLSDDAGWPNIYLALLDPEGQMIWEKSLGTHEVDKGIEAIATSDHGYAVIGESLLSDSSINTGVHLIKLDAKGDSVWGRTYGGPYMDHATSIIECHDKGFLMGGMYSASDALFSPTFYYLIRTDSLGNVLWSRKIDNPNYPSNLIRLVHDIVQVNDSLYAVTGFGSTFMINDAGDLLWISDRAGLSIETTKDDGLVIAIEKRLTCFEKNGEIRWTKEYDDIFLRSVSHALDGGFILAGTHDSTNSGLLMKVDCEGNVESPVLCTPTSITRENKGTKITIYPNPSDGIFYVAPFQTAGAVSIFNSLGKDIIKEFIPPYQRVVIDISQYPRGIYYYEVHFSDGSTVSGKLVNTEK
ncbi:MAG: T9SS type A sorting domain-containing protein [Bacteroidota bacterium]